MPQAHQNWLCPIKDLVVTLILWGYYTVGFIVLFAPFYIAARWWAKDVGRTYQALNARFYRWFFVLLRRLVPACRWRVDAAVQTIHGAVVVANHISYLDPILLISLFPMHTTIVKRRLFRIPLYGRILRLSGYIPASVDGSLKDLMLDAMERMPAMLSRGGSLIVFPEGTRSRDGRVGPLNRGAFKIARRCRAPIHVVGLANTDRLFRPGRFLFDTCSANTVRVDHLATVEPAYDDPEFSLNDLIDRVHRWLSTGCVPPAEHQEDE